VSRDDPRHFAGRHAPAAGGIATVELEDVEGVPPDRWLRFLVTVLPDKAPVVMARTEGIGTMVTPEAGIPLRIRATDDFGVTSLGIEHARVAEGKDPVSGKTPFDAIPESPTVEASPVWDLRPLGAVPGERLDARVFALDDDGIHGSKAGFAPSQSFLVVTAEKLLEEFLRREEEQRRILERSIAEEKESRDKVYRLVDEAWKVEGALTDAVVKDMIALSKLERQRGRQMASIAQAMQLILDEMRNNRIAEVTETERLAATVIVPLGELADRMLPAAANRVALIREMARSEDRVREGIGLAADVEAILSVMEKVVASMKRVEGFTEIVNRLRAVLKIQTESADEAVRTYRREIDKIFEDIPPEEGSKQ
jgi:hypothetical protein